jgi:hypothetical protein
MMKDTLLNRILSAVHIIFFTSILTFATIYLSGSLLLIPALAAAFRIGKGVMDNVLDANSGIVKEYFRGLKNSLTLMRFIPVNLLFFLNIAGMLAAGERIGRAYSIICLVLVAFLLVISMYIAGFYVFMEARVTMGEVALSMFIKPQNLIPVFILMAFFVIFFSIRLLAVLLITGSIFLYASEVMIYLQLRQYKKLKENSADKT